MHSFIKGPWLHPTKGEGSVVKIYDHGVPITQHGDLDDLGCHKIFWIYSQNFAKHGDLDDLVTCFFLGIYVGSQESRKLTKTIRQVNFQNFES